MAEEYNIPWKIEGEFVITGNGSYHRTEIEKIVNQRDHEINNLRCVNQILQSGSVQVTEKDSPKVIGNGQRHDFLKRYLRVI